MRETKAKEAARLAIDYIKRHYGHLVGEVGLEAIQRRGDVYEVTVGYRTVTPHIRAGGRDYDRVIIRGGEVVSMKVSSALDRAAAAKRTRRE